MDVPQHIIQRGNNRQATFFAEQDYPFYLDSLIDAARKDGSSVHAHVLMTNHVHLLASAEQPYGPSRMMQHLGSRFVRYINHVYRRTGTLWEGDLRQASSTAKATFCDAAVTLSSIQFVREL